MLSTSTLSRQPFMWPYQNQISDLICVYYFPGLFLNPDQLTIMVLQPGPTNHQLVPAKENLQAVLGAGNQHVGWAQAPSAGAAAAPPCCAPVPHIEPFLYWFCFSQTLMGSSILIVHPCSAFHYEGCWVPSLL